MRTSLVFKFFISLVFCLSVTVKEKLVASGFQSNESLLLADTITLPDTATEIIPQNDTLINPEQAEEIPPQEQRQQGSGMILDQKVDYSAKDSIRFDIRNQVVHLYGDAELQYGEINLTAAYIAIDFEKKELNAVGMPDSVGLITGKPVFTEGDQSFESEELRYNFESKRGWTSSVITEESDGFLHGDVVKIMNNKEVHVRFGKYTTCDDPNPHFHVSFARAKILPSDKIISSAPRLTIMGVRTPLMLPFGFFPNTKGQASGIIFPSYGETRNRGFYLENGGFYWGINDYIDLSLTGDIYSRGSWAAKVGSNYKKLYKYNGSFNFTYTINILGERNLPGYERNRDFRVVWSHNQDPKARPNSVFRASVNAGSSQFNRFSPTTAQDYLSNTFSSNISYSATWAGGYNFSISARHSQNTITKAVDLGLPDMSFSMARFYPLRRKNPQGKLRWYEEITMNYNAVASNQITTKEEEMFTPAMFSNMKNGVQHTIPISHSFRVLKHFNLSNSFNYNERWYFQKIERYWEATGDTKSGPAHDGWSDIDALPAVGQAGTIPGEIVNDTIRGFYAVREFSYNSSLNTRLYGVKQFSRGPVLAVRHVINPSLGFSFRPDYANLFWGYYDYYDDPNYRDPVRYSPFEGSRYGVPSAGRSGALNFNVTNNLEMKVRNRKDTVKGERKIALIDNLSFSTSYDLARDSLNLSDLRISGRTRLFEQVDVTYSSTWSPYEVDSLGRPINKFLWDTQKKLIRPRNSSWSLNFNYSISSKSQVKGGPAQGTAQSNQPGSMYSQDTTTEEETTHVDSPVPPGAIDFSVPWSLRFSYSFNYNSTPNYIERNIDRKVLQNLTFSGDFNLTPNWRVGFSSGYNFEMNEITYTSLDIYRDLHCWELMINWVPFGFRQSYNMTLRVKSSVLQDLKINRRTHHLDRAFQ